MKPFQKQKKTGQRFQPGCPPGPGRPKGLRNKVTMALQEMLDDQGELVIQKAISMALEGDSTAIRLVIERLVPVVRERHINLSLPKVETANDIVGAIAGIMEAVGAGTISPSEGQALAALAESARKSIETAELTARVAALEARRK